MPSQKQMLAKLQKFQKAAAEWDRQMTAEAQQNLNNPRGAWAQQSIRGANPTNIAGYKRMAGGNPFYDQMMGAAGKMRSGGGGQSSSGGGMGGGLDLGSLLGMYMAGQQQPQGSLQNQLSADFAQQLANANFNNNYRYQQMLGELSGLRGRSMDDIRSVGEQQRTDINEDFQRRQAKADQDLSRRGLLGTSRVTANERVLGEGRAYAQNRLADQLARARIDTDTATTGNLVGAIERRNDVAPELSQLMALQQGLGASGMNPMAGGGFGGGMVGGGGGSPFGGRWINGQYVPPPPMTQGPQNLMWQQQYGHLWNQAQGGQQGGGMGGPGNLTGGYPTVENGVVQPPAGAVGWNGMDPRLGGGMMGGGMMGGPRMLSASKTSPIQQQMESLILQGLQGGGGFGQQQSGGGGGSQPSYSRQMNPRPMHGGPIFMGSGMFNIPGMAYGQMPQMQRGVGWNGADPRLGGGGRQQAGSRQQQQAINPWQQGMTGTVGQPINWNRPQRPQRQPRRSAQPYAMNLSGYFS